MRQTRHEMRQVPLCPVLLEIRKPDDQLGAEFQPNFSETGSIRTSEFGFLSEFGDSEFGFGVQFWPVAWLRLASARQAA